MAEERPSAGSPSQIVVADDHPLIREALTRTIDEQPDLEIVGEATYGLEALELCRRLKPELVLMDVLMPKMDGLEATRQIKRESPRTSVLVLTASENPKHLSEALKAGAAGYVQKGATTQETIGAVRKVLEGESSLDPELATQLLKRLMEEPKPEPNGIAKGESPPGALSAREREVLGLVARGNTNQQVARQREHRKEARAQRHLQAWCLRPHSSSGSSRRVGRASQLQGGVTSVGWRLPAVSGILGR